MDWHDRHDDETMHMLENTQKFLKTRVPAVYKTHESKGIFPKELVQEMGSLGFFGITVPERYEGSERGVLMSSLIAREFAYHWGALHLIWTANSSLAVFPIMHAGNEEQKKKLLPLLATGKILGCYALTEPNAGSDAASMKTKATKNGDHWILNGNKTFITNALHASVAIVFAKTGKGRHDISAFILESKEPGLTLPGMTVRKIEKRVLKSSDFCELTFDGVILPENALLGQEGKGFQIAMATLDGGRINIAAQAVGLAARVFDDAFEYVSKSRSQFDCMVWKNQGVQFHFADWFSQLQAAWAMVLRASILKDSGVPITQYASATKLFATRTAKQVAMDAVEYFGGMSVTEEFEALARAMDTLPTPIYEGTSNIQRIVIARELEKGQR